MAQKRKANPTPRKEKATMDRWWDVLFMDVEIHKTDRGTFSICVAYTVDEREWPVCEYFVPDHKKDFVRGMWRNFKKEMADAGYTMQPAATIEDAIAPSTEWLMPSRIGVAIEEVTVTIDGEDVIREYVEVCERDWSDPEEGKKETKAAVKPDDDDLPF